MEEFYGEFSFNGHRCTEFGLHYIPSSSNRWYSSPSWKDISATVTGRHGKYKYGSTVEARTFTLECYFEDATIEQLEAMQRWLHRNQTGKLIFDDRPYVYYTVSPSQPSKGDIWASAYSSAISHRGSGKCTLYFEAAWPFGVLAQNSYTGYDSNGIRRHTGLLRSTQMPPQPSPAAGDFMLYNPGTEYTWPTFTFEGSAPNGLKITNHTTGETCTLTAFPVGQADTGIKIDGETGMITALPLGEPRWSCHSDGYIRLAPNLDYYRDIEVGATEGSNAISIYYYPGINETFVGKYVYLQNNWYKIISVSDDGSSAVLNGNVPEGRIETTDIVPMNELTLEGDGLQLTNFTVEYKAYVR